MHSSSSLYLLMIASVILEKHTPDDKVAKEDHFVDMRLNAGSFQNVAHVQKLFYLCMHCLLPVIVIQSTIALLDTLESDS
jgi:hypothetical protein